MPLSLPIFPLLLLGRCAQGQIFKGGFGSRSLGLDQVRDETSPEKYPDYGKCVFGNKPKSSSPLDQFRDDQELIMYNKECFECIPCHEKSGTHSGGSILAHKKLWEAYEASLGGSSTSLNESAKQEALDLACNTVICSNNHLVNVAVNAGVALTVTRWMTNDKTDLIVCDSELPLQQCSQPADAAVVTPGQRRQAILTYILVGMGVFAGFLFVGFLLSFYRYMLTKRILGASKKIMGTITVDDLATLPPGDTTQRGSRSRARALANLDERIQSLSGFSELKNTSLYRSKSSLHPASTLHPTHSGSTQPQCSCRHRVFQKDGLENATSYEEPVKPATGNKVGRSKSTRSAYKNRWEVDEAWQSLRCNEACQVHAAAKRVPVMRTLSNAHDRKGVHMALQRHMKEQLIGEATAPKVIEVQLKKGNRVQSEGSSDSGMGNSGFNDSNSVAETLASPKQPVSVKRSATSTGVSSTEKPSILRTKSGKNVIRSNTLKSLDYATAKQVVQAYEQQASSSATDNVIFSSTTNSLTPEKCLNDKHGYKLEKSPRVKRKRNSKRIAGHQKLGKYATIDGGTSRQHRAAAERAVLQSMGGSIGKYRQVRQTSPKVMLRRAQTQVKRGGAGRMGQQVFGEAVDRFSKYDQNLMRAAANWREDSMIHDIRLGMAPVGLTHHHSFSHHPSSQFRPVSTDATDSSVAKDVPLGYHGSTTLQHSSSTKSRTRPRKTLKSKNSIRSQNRVPKYPVETVQNVTTSTISPTSDFVPQTRKSEFVEYFQKERGVISRQPADTSKLVASYSGRGGPVEHGFHGVPGSDGTAPR